MNAPVNTTPAVHVLIVAAGIGSRFAADNGLPKQYHFLGNKAVLAHSIEVFNDINCHDFTVVTHPEDQWWSQLSFDSSHLVQSCEGGHTRRQSVINGLKNIQPKANHDDWVLVHDAARPCVAVNDINQLISTTLNHEVGGLLVRPISDTIKQSNDMLHSRSTINRDQLFAAQTPQMFRLGELLACLNNADEKTTDEASAFEQKNKHPVMIQGNSQNIKITYAEELALAEFFLKLQGRL